MIEESLLRSNFVGRDGFRWWVGTVAPFDGDGIADQANGGGWGNRTKVRIMGYHPFDDEELSNEDLPWAQILLPTTSGSGAGNVAENTKLRPSDSVFGFFLDGDNAQLPVIIGVFGRTAEVSQEKYDAPFVPFTGYTGRIENPQNTTGTPAPQSGGQQTLPAGESNENSTQSQKSPRDVPPKVIEDINNNINNLNSGLPENTPEFWKEVPSYTGIGLKVPLADTCEDSTIGTITGIVNNLFESVTGLNSAFINQALEISKSVRAITAAANSIVSNMFTTLALKLAPILSEGLGSLFAEITSPIEDFTEALLAGVGAQASFLEPIGFLQEALFCGIGNITNQLPEMVESLLNSVIDNALNFVSCVGTQFVGSLINDIISRVEGFMGPILEIVGGLLGEGLDIFGLLTSGVDAFTNISSIFECGQSNEKCGGIVKEYTIGKGPIDAINDVEAILENAKITREIGNAAVAIGTDINKKLEDVGLIEPGAESGLPECNTSVPLVPPEVRIFGGGGIETIQVVEETEEGLQTVEIPNEAFRPASARPVIEGFVKNADGRVTGSVVDLILDDPGFGYKFPPFVEIVDPAGKGYGAVYRSKINVETGSIEAFVRVSIGENYAIDPNTSDSSISDARITTPGGLPLDPDTFEIDRRRRLPRNITVGVGNSMNIGLTSILVVNSGVGYSSTDIIVDPFDIPYNNIGDDEPLTIGIVTTNPVAIIPRTTIPEFRIRTSTGTGAILKPIIGIPGDPNVAAGYTAGRLVQIIDCI